MKYIVYKDVEQAAIVFPEEVNHASVARRIKNMKGVAMDIISAGFVYRSVGRGIWVKGESESLNLRSRPEDAAIIDRSILQ